MATGLYPNNAGTQRFYDAKLLLGVEGFIVPPPQHCCGVRPPNDIPISIVVRIDCEFFIFTGVTSDVFGVLLGLMMVGSRKATSNEVTEAIRSAFAQIVDISISATIFECRYVVNGRIVKVFQRHDVVENLLMNGANQIVFAGDGSEIFVGA